MKLEGRYFYDPYCLALLPQINVGQDTLHHWWVELSWGRHSYIVRSAYNPTDLKGRLGDYPPTPGVERDE